MKTNKVEYNPQKMRSPFQFRPLTAKQLFITFLACKKPCEKFMESLILRFYEGVGNWKRAKISTIVSCYNIFAFATIIINQ